MPRTRQSRTHLLASTRQIRYELNFFFNITRTSRLIQATYTTHHKYNYYFRVFFMKKAKTKYSKSGTFLGHSFVVDLSGKLCFQQPLAQFAGQLFARQMLVLDVKTGEERPDEVMEK